MDTDTDLDRDLDRTQLIAELRRVLPPEHVLDTPETLEPYRSDWYRTHLGNPDVVVLPGDTEQVAIAVRLANRAALPIVPRGAGTGLAGGARPIRGGVVISTERMKTIQEVDIPNHRARIQPGIINYDLTQALLPQGYCFAPDPASWKICSVGGNIANNSGGPHCLKYGVTTNHILALEVVLHDGRVIWTGDGLQDGAGYDLTGLLVGSEGTLGFVTSAMVRLTRVSEARHVAMALFPNIINSSEAVSHIIAAGYIPTSLEVMDAITIKAVNTAYNYGLPDQAGAALIIEVDGVKDGLHDLLGDMITICLQQGAIDVRFAETEAEQDHLWAARKSAFEALRCVYPDYYLVDTVVPRTRLPAVIERIGTLSETYQLPIANVFHAGDGNLHPLVLYDPQNEDEVRRTHAIIEEVMRISIEEGGTITGEHGIGVDKKQFMPLLFREADLQAMATLYAIFNPHNQINPGKVFPSSPLNLALQHQKRLAYNYGERTGYELERWERDLQAALASNLEPAYLLHGDAIEAYTVQGKRPRLVAIPTSVEQLSHVLATCHRSGATVVPWGGGTQQGMGHLTAEPDVVVCTERLAGVLTYHPDDLTINVGAGTTVVGLQAVLEEHGQMLPLDVPMADRVTIGGLVATATDGPRRLGYGTLRDLVQGLTVVEVDGTVIHLGGQVVKNVSGYDMVKLFHGSHGTLGIIASVNMQTIPRPPAEISLLITFPRPDQVLGLLADLAATQLTPTAAEYLDHEALQAIGHEGGYGLVLRVEGTEVACQRHLNDLRLMAAKHTPLAVDVFRDEPQQELWNQLVSLTSAVGLKSYEALLRLVVPPARLGRALVDLEQGAVAHHMTLRTSARALNGIIYTRVSGAADGLRALCADLTSAWNHCHVLACDPTTQATLPRWGTPPEQVVAALEWSNAIKRAFDPGHRLNPGRLSYQ
jgi:D-lactate dehydrogenase (cytochrome)